MRDSYAHMRESMESTSDLSLSLFVGFSIRFSIRFSISFFPLLHRQLTSYSIILNIRHVPPYRRQVLESVLPPLLQSPSRSIQFSHSHAGLICAYEGVNGVNFHLIAQSFALSLFVSFFSPSASSLIQCFSVALNLRHFASLIVVLNCFDSVALSQCRSILSQLISGHLMILNLKLVIYSLLRK
jgi:hypothetical protein